jgi:acetyl esterase
VIGRLYLERGAPVTVLARWAGRGPRNVLVERADGTRVVRPFRGLRRPGYVERASSSIAAE